MVVVLEMRWRVGLVLEIQQVSTKTAIRVLYAIIQLSLSK